MGVRCASQQRRQDQLLFTQKQSMETHVHITLKISIDVLPK